MKVGPRLFGRPDPLMSAIAATFCAGALVLYLQHRAVGELRHQTDLVLEQIAEQTAQTVAADLRATLEGPVFDTLAAVNHPQIDDNRLDLLQAEFREGLAAYPQVERFFVWTENTQAFVPGEMLFLGSGDNGPGLPAPRTIPSGFVRDPALGRLLEERAHRAAPSQQIYAAYEIGEPAQRHVAFLRLFWTDARRDRYFAVIGFLVDYARVRRTLIPKLYHTHLEPLLAVRGSDLPFALRVVDEQGETVWGAASPPPVAGRVTLPMMFYPAHAIASRLSAGLAPATWTIEVSPARDNGLVGAGLHGYWLPGLSIVLMLVALTFTVQAGRRAAEMARMQADFVSHVSHQLKTPLSLLSAATETVALDRVRSPEKLARYIDTIRSEVGRLSSLVQRILEFSRVQQRRPFAFEDVDLAPLVRETVAAFEQSLSGQHFSFRIVQNGPSPRVTVDPAALEQVLANLLDNAVKYSGTVREVVVRIGWAGGEAVVEVVDRGIGIAPEDRRRIFEKFYRGSDAAQHSQGFGLGLPIVQQLMAAHRGRVEVESTPNEGSTFRIVLPVSRRPRRAPGAILEVLR